MGMHHGYLAIDAPLDRALDAMGALTGALILGDPATRIEDLTLEDDDDGWHLAIGERDGRTYLLDASMILSSDPDFVTALSAGVAATVVGAGAETVSGTFWFAAATSGGLRRFHWNGYDSASAPFDIGEPLATEIDAPLEDIDGVGLMAAADSMGFDLTEWAGQGPWRALTYTADPFPAEGSLGAQLNEHIAANPVDGGAAPTVVRRSGEGGHVGYDIAHPKLAATTSADTPALPSDRQIVAAVRRRPSMLVWLAVFVVMAGGIAWVVSRVIESVPLSLVIGAVAAAVIGRGLMALASRVSRDE